tara:strand:+ start:1776 stop:2000 length:225 start_codon:yes stop_codon:yes gene_type:complete
MSSPNSVTVSQVSDVTTVEVTTAGPQGPSFTTSNTSLNDSSKVDGSVVYYDSTSATFKADSTTTKLTLVNGGNF